MSEAPQDDHASAVEILEQSLVRLRRECDSQREYLADLIEQLRIAELMLSEASIAVAAVETLLGGALYEPGGPIIAKWDGLQSTLEIAGVLQLPPVPDEPEPEPVLALTMDDPALAEVAPEVVAIEEPPAAEPEPEAAPVVETPTNRAERLKRDPGASPKIVGQCERFLALLRAAGGETTISLSSISAQADIPQGSVHFALTRLVDLGQITITKNIREGSRAPAPTTYRLVGFTPEIAPTPAMPPAVKTAPKPQPRPTARERAIPRGARIESLNGGVQVIRLKPVTESVARHAKAQIDRGADLEEVADLFDADPDALRRAVDALSVAHA